MDKFDLVVARYKEDISWTQRHAETSDLYVYQKEGKDITLKPDEFKNLKNLEVLKNRGREASSYLAHITRFYNSENKGAVFCQGNPFEHYPDFHDYIEQHSKGDNFVWFGRNTYETDRYMNFVSDAFAIPIGELYEDIFRKQCPEKFYYLPWACFYVPYSVIRKRDIRFYYQAYHLLLEKYCVGERAECVQSSYYGRGAWAMERLWGAMFGLTVVES